MRPHSTTTLLTIALTAGIAAAHPAPAFGLPHCTQKAGPTYGQNTVADMDPETAIVRLQKLGYTNIQRPTRSGDFWVATATKAGKTTQVSVHAKTGAITEKPAASPPK